jgi:hypothetical protein
MRKLTILLMAGIAGYYFWTIQKKDIENPHKPVYIKIVEQDFHEDFDSTYYYYGCKADTFKANHKCNGK